MSQSRIVVGIDDSPASVAAMNWAAEEAELRNAELRLVYVWQVEASLAMAGVAVPWNDFEEDARTHAAAWVKNAIGEVGPDGEPRTIEVVQGSPGPAMVELSRNADMLVIGTQVHTGLRRVLHGSVSHYCLTHAECVVVAVPVSAS